MSFVNTLFKPSDINQEIERLNQILPDFDAYPLKAKIIPIYLINAMQNSKVKVEQNKPCEQNLSYVQKVQNTYKNLFDQSLPKLYAMIEKQFDSTQRLSNRQTYTCHHQGCGKLFPSSCSLGGHISRTHSQKTKLLRELALAKRTKKIRKK